jgi:hypothetical protein
MLLLINCIQHTSSGTCVCCANACVQRDQESKLVSMRCIEKLTRQRSLCLRRRRHNELTFSKVFYIECISCGSWVQVMNRQIAPQ